MIAIYRTSHPTKMIRTLRGMIPVAMAFAGMLACPNAAHALPRRPSPDGDPDPIPTCIPSAQGSIWATPSSIDLRPGSSRVTTLHWSATVTESCPSFRGFQIFSQSVGASGSMDVTLTTPGRWAFSLSMRVATGGTGGTITVASTAVDVVSPLVAISDGRNVTPQDIQNFDYMWMYPPLVAQTLDGFTSELQQSHSVVAWDIGERTEAMVHMYELTHDLRYLDHLRDIVRIVLTYRDDRYGWHLDAFRPDLSTPMPAWGQSSPATAYYWEYIGDTDSHFEDASHGAVSMRYLGLLRENQSRLDASLRIAGDEPIALTSADLTKFANTFIYNVFRGDHLVHDVTGRAEDNPVGRRDRECTGWLSLAQTDPRVYEQCAAITLRIIDGVQPNLGIANHAALLQNKQFRGP
jgi:hypothetical protein